MLHTPALYSHQLHVLLLSYLELLAFHQFVYSDPSCLSCELPKCCLLIAYNVGDYHIVSCKFNTISILYVTCI